MWGGGQGRPAHARVELNARPVVAGACMWSAAHARADRVHNKVC